MYLKRVLLVVLALPLVPTHANAQITADQEHDYQRRIAALEERLAVVEGQLETLLRDRAAAAPARLFRGSKRLPRRCKRRVILKCRRS